MSLTHYGARAATGASLAQKMMPADPSILPELHWLLLNEMPPLITRPEVCAILARARIEPSTLLMGFAENRFPIGQWYAGFQEHSAAVRAMHKRRLICGTTTIGVRKTDFQQVQHKCVHDKFSGDAPHHTCMVTGAPFQTQPVDLCRFFDGFDLDLPNAFYFERSPNNDVVVRFKSQSEAQRAMREKNMRPLLSRFVRVFALS